jgi:hypothetical protein
MNRSLVGLDLELSSICCNFTAIYTLLNFICMCASNYLDFGVYERWCNSLDTSLNFWQLIFGYVKSCTLMQNNIESDDV